MKQDELEKIIMDIHGKVCKIEANSEATSKAMFGNGQPGLQQRFEVLATECTACKDGRKKRFAVLVASMALLAPVASWLFRIVFGI